MAEFIADDVLAQGGEGRRTRLGRSAEVGERRGQGGKGHLAHSRHNQERDPLELPHLSAQESPGIDALEDPRPQAHRTAALGGYADLRVDAGLVPDDRMGTAGG